uniref:Chromosome 22 open reading frame 23 n=1 Tax=Leptobrachium leishanense TaxID=445787 RepID=A0A8C5WDL3_9ANUR
MPLKDGNVNVPTGTGFWNNAKPVQYSKETQDLLRVMMQESKLTNFQQRQIRERLQCGDTLPTQCHPSSSNMGQKKNIVKIQRTNVPIQCSRPSLRPAEKCRAGDAYSREKFHPHPTRDLNKEKSRLQNIMATGSEPPEPKHAAAQRDDPVEERDRFDELVAEIQERWAFLAEMEALGRGKQYSNMINTEISQGYSKRIEKSPHIR